jgi:MFS family permease
MIIMIQSGAFLLTMRLGGWLADVWANRWPVVISFSVQLAAMILYSLQTRPWSVGWFIGWLVLYGLGAGMSLAPLHRSVMHDIPTGDSGTTAGFYSMIRSGGDLFGAALGGMFLQLGLDRGLMTLRAYQLVVWVIAGICLLNVAVSWGLKD